MLSKTALLYPGQIHLRLGCLCFLPVFIFCFVFLLCLINTFPSEEAKHSLCSVPLGMGVGVGRRRGRVYI